MEPRPDSETSRSPVSRSLALVASSLAMVAAAKNVEPQTADPQPLKLYKDALFTYDISARKPTAANHCATSTRIGSGKERVERDLFNFFIHGPIHLSVAETAGIGGNLEQESPFDTSGDGIAQWTGKRYAAMTKYVDEHPSMTVLNAQIHYIGVELTHGHGAGEDDRPALADLRKTHTPSEAAIVFSTYYERPGQPLIENRIRYAEKMAPELGHLACERNTATQPPTTFRRPWPGGPGRR